MTLVLHTDLKTANYQLVKCDEDDRSILCFINLVDNTCLFKLNDFTVVSKVIDDHTVEISSSDKDSLCICYRNCYRNCDYRNYDCCIEINDGSVLTIDENTLKNSALNATIESSSVVVLNSIVIGDCYFCGVNGNIVDSFVYLFGDIVEDEYNEFNKLDEEDEIDDFNIVDCIYSNIGFRVPSFNINQDETLIVLALDQTDFVKYVPDEETIVLELRSLTNDIEIHIDNINKYCLSHDKYYDNINYIMCIGNDKMSIHRINKKCEGEEYANDYELEAIKQKYYPKNHSDAYSHVQNLHYNSDLINVEYCKNILAGIKYLQDNQDHEDQTKLNHVCNNIAKCKVFDVEKGAKLFMNDYICFINYYVNIKENAIVSLYDKYYNYVDDEYIKCSKLLPNFLMKAIIGHTSLDQEDITSSPMHIYGEHYAIETIKALMNEQ